MKVGDLVKYNNAAFGTDVALVLAIKIRPPATYAEIHWSRNGGVRVSCDVEHLEVVGEHDSNKPLR